MYIASAELEIGGSFFWNRDWQLEWLALQILALKVRKDVQSLAKVATSGLEGNTDLNSSSL